MPRKGLTLLIAMGLLLAAGEGWSEDAATAAAASTTIDVPVAGSAATPMAATSAAPAAVSAPAAQASAPAAGTATAPAAATAQVAASPAIAAPAPASAAPAAEAPAPAAAVPAEAAAPAPAFTGSVQLPVRGMDMANVEHIFGTPLEKRDPVGKPPITRWVYSDYVVYFEYNKVLHTVMKSAPFSSPGAS